MKKIICTLCLCLGLLGVNAQNYTWTNMPQMGQTFYSPGSFTIDSNMYVLGGWTVSVIAIGGYPVPLSHEVWAFNTYTHTWTQKNNFPGTAVYGGRGFTIGSYGYFVNGWDSTGSGQGPNTTWKYDPTTDTWTQKAAFPGSTRYTCSTFALNGKGFVACGFSPYVSDMFSYDPVSDTWSTKASFPGGGRQDMAFMTIGNTEYVGMGSRSDGMGSYFLESDWYKYDAVADSWTQLAPFPGDAADAPFCFSLNGEGYIVNGLNQNSVYYSNAIAPSNKVWKYSPSSDSWTLWGVFPDSATFGGAYSAGNDGAAYMGFGSKNFQNYPLSSKFFRFGPGTAPYSCTVTANKYEISNAIYNFQANGNFSPTAQITWNFGDGNAGAGASVIHNFASTGTYSVEAYVVDTASGCADSSGTSVTITNVNNCSIVLNSTNFGTTFTLSTIITQGAGPYTYQWSCTSDSTFSSNSPDPLVNVPLNTPTTYCVSVTDTTGCLATACKTVVDSQTFYTPCQIYLVIYPDPLFPGSYYAIFYTAGSGPLTYLWDFGDGTTSNQEFPNHTYTTPGQYTVCLSVSDGNGCSFSFCDSSFYAYKYGGGPMGSFSVKARQVLGINNITNKTQIAIYPNPTDANLTIDAAGQKVSQAIIYDVSGREVINISAPVQNKVDVSNLPAGIYFMEVKVLGTSTRIKFVKAN